MNLSSSVILLSSILLGFGYRLSSYIPTLCVLILDIIISIITLLIVYTKFPAKIYNFLIKITDKIDNISQKIEMLRTFMDILK